MRWLTRLLLLRFLPRRLVPLLAAWEVFQLVRGRKDPSDATRQRAIPGPATRRPPTR